MDVSPEFLLFLAFAIAACALALGTMPDEKHRDARRRNPERTWDDRP